MNPRPTKRAQRRWRGQIEFRMGCDVTLARRLLEEAGDLPPWVFLCVWARDQIKEMLNP